MKELIEQTINFYSDLKKKGFDDPRFNLITTDNEAGNPVLWFSGSDESTVILNPESVDGEDADSLEEQVLTIKANLELYRRLVFQAWFDEGWLWMMEKAANAYRNGEIDYEIDYIIQRMYED